MDMYFNFVGPGFCDFTRVKIDGWRLTITTTTIATGYEVWDAPEGGHLLMHGNLPTVLFPGDTLVMDF
jgi:hypothetical protein